MFYIVCTISVLRSYIWFNLVALANTAEISIMGLLYSLEYQENKSLDIPLPMTGIY